MINKKGQGLVESVAVLGFCTLFFLFCFNFFANFFREIQKDYFVMEAQICKQTDRKNCPSEGGFVLVMTLIQLLVVLFAGHLAIALMAVQDNRWKTLNSCFESGLQSLTSEAVPLSEKLKQLRAERNKYIDNFVEIQSTASEPFVSAEHDSNDRLRSVHYLLRWKYSVSSAFNFFSPSDFEQTFKCGAKRLCKNQKCTYSLIADRY